MVKRIARFLQRIFWGEKHNDLRPRDLILVTNQEDKAVHSSDPKPTVAQEQIGSPAEEPIPVTNQEDKAERPLDPEPTVTQEQIEPGAGEPIPVTNQEDKAERPSDPEPIRTTSENVSQVKHKDFAVTFSGMPADVPLETQVKIAKEIVRRFLEDVNRQQSYKSGQVIADGQFFLEIEQEKTKIYYELKTLRFITALQIYRDALEWLAIQETAGAMNSDVAEITAKHIKALAQDELTAIKFMKRATRIVRPPHQEIEVKPSKKNYIADKSQKKNHKLDK